jgi:hypothetical protein
MSEVFKDLGSTFLKVFVDDLNVHSQTWGEHIRHLDAVLCKLREVNLKLNPSKCCFATKSITFLGHVVSREGIQPDPGKIATVLHFPTPKNVTSVKSFLGLTGYYRKYIKGYSSLAGPLFELTRKDVVFVWDVNCEQAYQALKAALVDAPVLTRPDFTHDQILGEPSGWTWIGHPRELEPYCHKKKGSSREWWHMPARV